MAGRPSDVEVPQPPYAILICIWVAIDATNRHQFGCPERTEEHFTPLKKSVPTGLPLNDKSVHEAKSFHGGLDAEVFDAGGQIE